LNLLQTNVSVNKLYSEMFWSILRSFSRVL